MKGGVMQRILVVLALMACLLQPVPAHAGIKTGLKKVAHVAMVPVKKTGQALKAVGEGVLELVALALCGAACQ